MPVATKQRFARWALLAIIALPSLPAFAVFVIALLAALKGCWPNQADVCLLGPWPVSTIIETVLKMTVAYLVDALGRSDLWLLALYIATLFWTVLCLSAVVAGWKHLAPRLLLGGLVTAVLGPSFFFGPLLSFVALARGDACKIDSGVSERCALYGGAIESAQATISFAEPSISLGAFFFAALLYVLFAVAVCIAALFAQRRTSRFRRQPAR